MKASIHSRNTWQKWNGKKTIRQNEASPKTLPDNCSKLIISEKVIQSVELDPHLETAAVDQNNNYFPPQIKSSRFKLFQDRKRSENEMQKAGLGKKEDEKKSEAPKDGEKAQP